jgi:hypothetical protein
VNDEKIQGKAKLPPQNGTVFICINRKQSK